ncbi:MAG TPA: CocE/NonD family hydrolase [Thermomicrobiales bacterium]|nr:CocE/NonD family hydrolase [Thermomicrobiales bacterium]
MDDWRSRPESEAEYGVVLASEVMIPMRDGARMATDLYFPAVADTPGKRAEGQFPVILLRTPYDKRTDASRALGEHFSRRGYIVAIQDCRGRYRSEGTFYFLTQEAEDGYDAVEWAGAQPWSTGRVGMMGTSYVGWTQTAAAVLNPPHLATMVVNQAGSNAYSSSVRHNGAMELRFLAWAFMEAATGPQAVADPALAEAMGSVSATSWLKNLPLRKGLSPLARIPAIEQWAIDIYTHGDYDEYWEHPGFNFRKFWDGHSDVPLLLCGAWYDSYTRATVENFIGLSERKRGPVHLVLGPWTHGGQSVDLSYSGDVEFGPSAPVAGNLAANFDHLHLQWFDRWLKDIDNGVDREDPVRIYIMGGDAAEGTKTSAGRLFRGGSWRTETSFPLPRAVKTPFYLHGDGSLSVDASRENGSSTTYRFDPANPVPTIGGNISSLSDMYPVPAAIEERIPPEHRRGAIVKVGGQNQHTDAGVLDAQEPYMPLSARDDVVVFQSEPLEAPCEVTGPLSATLYVSSSAPDTDFTVKLIDLFPPSADYPHGYALNLSDSIFRCRYRNDFSKPEMMEPGEIYKLEIPMYGTGTIFGRGHRIRIDISSSNFPRFDVNPNTGEPIGRHHGSRVADNTIHHDRRHQSHITLPVVPLA